MMSHINVLAIDLSQSSDSVGISANTNGAKQSDSSQFSELMAKHQERDTGNNSRQERKQSGNIGNENKDQARRVSNRNGRDESSLNKANAIKDSAPNSAGERAESANNTSDTTADNVQSAEPDSSQKEHFENTDDTDAIATNEATNEAIQEEGSHTVSKVAQELLSFIVASDGVSTEHISEVDIATSTQNEINTATSKSSNASNSERVNLKDVEALTKTYAHNSAASQAEDGDKTEQNTPKVAQQASEALTVQVKGAISQAQALEVKVSDDGDTLGSIASQDIIENKTYASDKALSLADQKATLAQLSTSDAIEVKKAPVDEMKLTGKLAQEMHISADMRKVDRHIAKQETVEVAANIEVLGEKVKGDPDLTLNKSAEHITTVNSQTIDDKTIKSQVKQAVEAVIETKGPVSKAVDGSLDNESSRVRIVNQTIVNQVNTASKHQGEQASSQQQGNGAQQQSNSQSNNQQVTTDSMLQEDHQIDVKVKQNEPLSTSLFENKVGQSQIDARTAERSISQQSLSYAEEQAAQQVIAKANADSMSVQSAKTAINIHNETISIYRKDFSNALKDKVMVMVNQKLRQLEIRLDPPELGSMQVRLNLQNEQAAVNFVVQNQQAKEALEQNINKLKDMLADSGVDVGDANIEQRDHQSSEQDELASNFSDKQQASEQELSESKLLNTSTNLYKASATGVDYYA